ncbi:MAG: cation:proton antiporter, partial [Moraxellaceae bacterium]|nr:cation:proton antiporter [Moraxellaceae bacterium]
MIDNLLQILLLLSVSVTVIVIFQRLHIPTSLGYLFVGVILSPYTIGPALDVPEIKALAEFGVVFLLFTIGLNYSLPQLHALRGQVLGLGTAQVVLGTALVMGIVWWLGVPLAAAFVVGAVFAQSS